LDFGGGRGPGLWQL